MMSEMNTPARQASLDRLAYLNAADALWLRLFTNDALITPSLESLSSYSVASYTGYSSVGILNRWRGPTQLQPGLYGLDCGPWQFAANPGPDSVVLRGWFIQRNNSVIYADKFTSPIVLGSAQKPPAMMIRIMSGSQSVICLCPSH